MRLPSISYSRRSHAGERDYLIVLLALAICLLSTAAIIANIEAVPFGSGPSFNLFLSRISNFLLPSAATLWFIALALLLLRRRQIKRVQRRSGLRSDQTSVVGIFIFLTLLVALAAISGSGNYSEQTAQNPPDNGGPSSGGDGQQTSYFSTPESFLSLLPFVCILVLVFFLALRHMKAERALVVTRDQPISEMTALQNAIHILNQDPDARSGILRSYAEMCTMLSDPDLEVSLTPKELERLVTDQLRWPKRPVHQLTELFQEARYSHHALEEEHKVTALDSLNELKTILEERAHAQ